MLREKNVKRSIKLFIGMLFTLTFIWMFSSLYYADMIKTSTLLPYDSIEVNENLVLYVDKDITLTSLWGRASDGNKVNFYDVVILPVGKHTITIDARTLSGNVKSALISKDLIIHDGVNLKILSNDKGIDCKGELTIGKADVLIQCVNTNAYYGAFYVESTKFNFLESEIVEPKGANIYQYTVYDPSTHDTAMKVRIAPKGTNTVIKKANPMTVQAKKVKIKASKLAKKKQTIKPAKYLTVSNAQGNLAYKLTGVKKKKFKKYFKVNPKNGNITVKKGLKKGTYKLNIDITAAGNGNYLPATKQVTVTIRVK